MNARRLRIPALLAAACLWLCGCVKAPAPDNTAAPQPAAVTASPADKPVLVGDIPCAFPLVSQPERISVLASRHGDTEYDDVYVWQQYARMTGVEVDWTTITIDQRGEAINAALMNKTAVDLILRCKVSARRLTQYGESGLILDLNKDGLLARCAPNCWHYLQTHPDTLASVTNPDGTIYALPQVNAGAELRVSRKLFINRDWLRRVDLPLPTTTEELYQLLRAFQEQDANGNGDSGDEIPLCSRDWLSIQESLSGAFGLMNRGAHNPVVDCDEASGAVRLTAATEGYRDFLDYCRRLYTEGLMDPNTFTMTDQEWTDNALNDRIGVCFSTNLASFPASTADKWVGIDEALEGPRGHKLWTAIRANFHSTGNAILPATCRDPALVLRWLDYFWTDEGTLFYHLGVEGETYARQPDGSYDYLPKIYEEMARDNLTFDDAVSRYTPYPGGGNPTVEIAPYFMGGEMAPEPAETARALFAYGPAEYWPSFTFTAEESELLSKLSSDLTKYIDASAMDFITGRTPLSQWDAYLAQLTQLRSAELTAVYQAALDRYRALLNSQS